MKVHQVRLLWFVVGVIPNWFQRGICHPFQLHNARVTPTPGHEARDLSLGWQLRTAAWQSAFRKCKVWCHKNSQHLKPKVILKIVISDLSMTHDTDTPFLQPCIIEIIIGAKLTVTGTGAPFFLVVLHVHMQSEVLQVPEILRFGWCHCPRVPRWVGEGPIQGAPSNAWGSLNA